MYKNKSNYVFLADGRGTEDDNVFVDLTNQLTKYLGVNNVIARRKNGFVALRIEGRYTGQPSLSTQLILSGLPAKYRPAREQYYCGIGYAGSDVYVFSSRVIIHDDGRVSLAETGFPNDTAIRIFIIYMI